MKTINRFQWLSRVDSTNSKLGWATGILSFFFSLELIIHNGGGFLEAFYVGKIGSNYLAAISLSIIIMTVFFTFFFEMNTSLTVLTAQYIGAGDISKAENAIGQTLLLILVISLPISVIGIFLAPALLYLMGAEPQVVLIGTPYLRFGFAAMALLILPGTLNAAMHGLGYAFQAIAIEIFLLILLFILLPLFLQGPAQSLRLGVTGAILSLIIARFVALLAQILFFRSRHSMVTLRLRNFQPHLLYIRQLFALNLPLTCQQLVRAAADIAVVRLAANFGSATIAGYAICLQSVKFLESISQGVANSVFTTVGQNLGDNRGDRAIKSINIASAYGLISVGIFILFFNIYAPQITRLFNNDHAVVDVGISALRIISFSYIFICITFILSRSFHGAGNTTTPFLVDIVTLWGIQIPLAYILSNKLDVGANGIWSAILIANAFRFGMIFIWFRLSLFRTLLNPIILIKEKLI